MSATSPVPTGSAGININNISIGKVLKIPTRNDYSSSVSSERKTEKRNSQLIHATRHVVNRGDSLWIIARRYGTTTKEIRDLNNLASTRLHIGQVLKLPGSEEKEKTSSSEKLAYNSQKRKTYLVKNGDIPAEIAKRHNISLQRFLNINHLTYKSKIYPGQVLFVD